jgi:two-component system OmpR family response regulator
MAKELRRILVTEDDHETVGQLVDFLAASGYQVDLASDGDDGLGHARSANYAVITIDRMLPSIDRIESPFRFRDECYRRLSRACPPRG